MRGRVATLLAAAGLLMGLGGCGDDDAPIEPIDSGATTSTTASVSQSEFIVSADARCSEANAAIANLTGGADAAATTASQEREITQGLLDGLQGIGTTDDPDGSLQRYYSALEDQIRILKQQEKAIAGGDTATAEGLDANLESARSDAADAASQYGFEECGGQGTTLPESGTTTGVAPTVPETTVAPAPSTTTPVTPTPVTPAEPAAPPATAPPDTGGGTPSAPSGGSTGGGSSGGSSGGISPG